MIFIEVALTRTMTAQVQPLLDPESPVDDPTHSTCAIFYSITNCQQGLKGVSFGNVLIKQVVEDLGKEFPSVKTIATLSPIPGFRAWLEERAATAPQSISPALAALVAKGDDFTERDIAAAPGALREEMMERCARYLVSTGSGVGAQDSVARFHLANGARLERLNWMGDVSSTGLRRSYGLTVNYVYRLDRSGAQSRRLRQSVSRGIVESVSATHEISPLEKLIRTEHRRLRARVEKPASVSILTTLLRAAILRGT